MHHCTSLHEAMTSLTCKKHETSDQHVDMGKTRQTRDTDDLHKLIAWFDDNNPYDTEVKELKSLSTGLTSKTGDKINCDEAESVGQRIQCEMDDVAFSGAKIKRSSKVKTLQDLQPGIKIWEKMFHVDPGILLLRCVEIARRTGEDIESYFKYELSTEPSSLFQDNFMRHGEKSVLANTILQGTTADPVTEVSMEKTVVVLDGGWLLNRVRWQKGTTYRAVIFQYRSYVKNHFGIARVIFDGYNHPNMKDHEQIRRAMNAKKRANTVSLKLDNKAHDDQTAFLVNVENKIQFIEELANWLEEDGHSVTCCDGDADTTIVRTALVLARNKQSVEVVSDDTDILILLMSHWEDTFEDIFLRKEPKTKGKVSSVQRYSIRRLCSELHPSVKEHIIFVHAWSGCDTTSQIYGFGKTSLLKPIKEDNDVRVLASAISDVTGSADSVGEAGVKLFSHMYGNSGDGGLKALRHVTFKTMMADKNKITVQRIPPSDRAAYFHSLRVHVQVVVWMKLDENALDPLEWGWKRGTEGLEPIRMDLPPAPESVLKFIRCKCKSLKNQCGTNVCSCRKNGLKCVDVCGGCHGDNCTNTENVDLGDGIDV